MKRLVIAAVAALGLLSAGVADAAWLANGAGQGTAVAGTLVAPASATASASGSTVTVTWPAAVGAPAGSSYVVTRSPAGGTCGATATTTCTDTGVADGTYSYSVRTVAGSAWTSASVTSNSVTITTAPPPPTATTFSVTSLIDSSDSPSGSTWTPRVTATVADNLGAALNGATINASYVGKNGGSPTGNTSCVTSGSGQCVLSIGAQPNGVSPVTFTITGGSPPQGSTLTYTAGVTSAQASK